MNLRKGLKLIKGVGEGKHDVKLLSITVYIFFNPVTYPKSHVEARRKSRHFRGRLQTSSSLFLFFLSFERISEGESCCNLSQDLS